MAACQPMAFTPVRVRGGESCVKLGRSVVAGSVVVGIVLEPSQLTRRPAGEFQTPLCAVEDIVVGIVGLPAPDVGGVHSLPEF